MASVVSFSQEETQPISGVQRKQVEPATLYSYLPASEYPISLSSLEFAVGENDVVPLFIDDAGNPITLGLFEKKILTNKRTGNILALTTNKNIPSTDLRRDANIILNTPTGILQQYAKKTVATKHGVFPFVQIQKAVPGSLFVLGAPLRQEDKGPLGITLTNRFWQLGVIQLLPAKQLNWADDRNEVAIKKEDRQEVPPPLKPTDQRQKQTAVQKQKAYVKPEVSVLRGRLVRYANYVPGLMEFVDISWGGRRGEHLEVQYDPQNYIIDQETGALLANHEGAFFRLDEANKKMQMVYVLPGGGGSSLWTTALYLGVPIIAYWAIKKIFFK